MPCRFLFGIMLLAAALTVAGCGDYDSSSAPQTRTVSGYTSKGIIVSGVATAYKIDSNGNKIMPKLAEATTDSSGFYSMNIGSYYGPIVIEVVGSYTDEATGVTATISTSSPLKAATLPPNNATPIIVNVTALTEIAYNKAKSVEQTFTETINAANQQVSSSFMVQDILRIIPLDASKALPTNATDEQKRYTIVLAAVSQIAAGSLPSGTTAPTPAQLATALSTALTTLTSQLPEAGSESPILQRTVSNAATEYLNNPANVTGVTVNNTAVLPIILSDSRKNVTFTVAVGNSAVTVPDFGAAHGSIVLPVGMKCDADSATGELQGEVVSAIQSGAMVNGNFRESTRILTIQGIRAAGFSLGNILSVTCNIGQNDPLPALSAFMVDSSSLDVNNGGLSLSGFILAISSVR